MSVKDSMNTATAFELLSKSLQDLCRDFNQKRFLPLLEADITAYLYHRLLVNGCSLKCLFTETRVCGVTDERRRKYDLVMGEVDPRSACVKPVLIAEIKCFQRLGHTHQQHRRRFEEIISSDLTALNEASEVLPVGRFEIIIDLVFTSQTVGYLTGTWYGEKRRDSLVRHCRNVGISLLWVRPNTRGDLEVERLL